MHGRGRRAVASHSLAGMPWAHTARRPQVPTSPTSALRSHVASGAYGDAMKEMRSVAAAEINPPVPLQLQGACTSQCALL